MNCCMNRISLSYWFLSDEAKIRWNSNILIYASHQIICT